MNFTSKDLDLLTNNLVGLRYAVCVPVGAQVTAATLTFTAEEDDTGAATANIRAEATSEAISFVENPSLTNRDSTEQSVDWEMPEFVDGEKQPTPDLAAVVAEVTSRPDWDGCGHIVFIIETDGHRDAHSFDSVPALAAVLDITFVD